MKQASEVMGFPDSRHESFECIECEEMFNRIFMVVQAKHVGPELCPACSREARLAESMPVQTPPTTEGDLLNRMHEIGVNVPRHGHITLADIETTQPSVVAVATQFMQRCLDPQRWKEHRGLYLLGDPGRGKTQVMVAVIRELLIAGMQPHDLQFDRARALVGGVRDRYGTGTVESYLERRRSVRVWFLDDAGRESPGADAFRAIDDVFDAREGHLTMLTSNLEPDEMAKRWAGEDNAGSFNARLTTFDFKRMEGKDWR